MGKILNSNSLQLMVSSNWISEWYREKLFPQSVLEDDIIREYIENVYNKVDILTNKIRIKRTNHSIIVYHETVPIKQRTILEQKSLLQNNIRTLSQLLQQPVNIIIKQNLFLDAKVIAGLVGHYLKKGKSLQYVFSKILLDIKKHPNIKGIKIEVSGRPKKMDMAKTEWLKYGQIPLHSYNKKIDYAQHEIILKFGKCSIKAWIHFSL